MKVFIPFVQTYFSTTASATYLAGSPSVTPSTFSGSTTYSVGAYVKVGDNVYKKLTASGASSTSPADDLTNWVFVGVLNYRAMLDGTTSSRTAFSSGVAHTITLGYGTSLLSALKYVPNALMLFGCNLPASVTVQVYYANTDGSVRTMLFNSTISGASTNLYIPTGNIYQDSVYELRVNISFSGVGINASIGELRFGRSFDLGATKSKYDISIIDYSKKLVDEFGNVSIAKRGFSTKVNASSLIEDETIYSDAYTLLTENRSTRLGWIVDEARPATYVLGYCQTWRMARENVGQDTLELAIEGVV